MFELLFPGLDADKANSVWKKQLQKPAKEDKAEDEDALAE